MDFNYLLIWIVCFSCIISLFWILRFSLKKNLGWLVVCCLILIITSVTLYYLPQFAGFISVIIWSIFWLIPSWGISKVNRWMAQQRYQKAEKLMIWIRWLHPMDGWFEKPKFISALRMAQQGQMTNAIKILQSYHQQTYQIQVLPYWLKADWENCFIWMQKNIPQQILFNDPNLLNVYLRALGETGQLNELLQILAIAEQKIESLGNNTLLYLNRVYALAFCGQILQVRQLFNTVLSNHPKSTQKFWLATAQMVAQKKAVARQELLSLRLENDLILNNAIEWRLVHPLGDPEKLLEPQSLQILHRITTNLNQEFRYRGVSLFKTKKAYATLFLIIINTIFFILEIFQGGSENIETLYQFGGLVPENVVQGQWWRLITANFLHYGWVHFTTNMLGLFMIGRLVEAILGMSRYLIVYSISGIGAMGVYTLIHLYFGENHQILVGASAAIMGLIGCIFAISLEDFYRDKSSLATRRLQIILLIIGLQFSFDLTSRQISLLSHVLGLMIGFLSSLIIVPKMRKSQKNSP